MSLRLKYKVRPQIFDTSEEKDKYFFLDDTTSERTIDSAFTKAHSGKPTVAAATSEDLSLGDLTTCAGCYVEVSHECTIKINGSTDAITIKPSTDQNSASSGRFFLEATITQLNITAPAGQEITVRYAVWGT